MSNETLDKFQKLGMDASYHFADDTGKEWGIGFELQREAEAIFAANPDLHQQMREISKKFLWSLK